MSALRGGDGRRRPASASRRRAPCPAAQRSAGSLAAAFPDIRRPRGPGRLPARRRLAAQLRLRGGDRRVSRRAEATIPAFAMAYWGEAMAFSQPLWFHEEPEQGRAALAKLGATPQARLAKATTPREQGYLRAVEALCGARRHRPRGHRPTPTRWPRSRQQYPARRRGEGVPRAGAARRPCRAAMRRCRCAAGRGDRRGVFARNPKHPGAPHYILHAYDHGDAGAAQALPAARAYAKIAPAASHALHMPAHAFLQLGLLGTRRPPATRPRGTRRWPGRSGAAAGRHARLPQPDVAAVRVDAAGAVRRGRRGGRARSTRRWRWHSRPTPSAATTTPTARSAAAAGRWRLRNDKGSMRARYIVESERWREMRGQGTFDNIDELFASGLSALRLKDVPRAEAVRGELQKASAPEHGCRPARAGGDPAPRAGGGRGARVDGHARRGLREDGRGGASCRTRMPQADRPAVPGEGRRRALRRAAARGRPRRRRRWRGSSGR